MVLKYLFSTPNDNWYKNLFKGKEITGEITPSYAILSLQDIRRIKLIKPNTKVIFILRNPSDRLWSSYKYSLRGEASEKFSFNHFKKFLKSENQKLRSQYLDTINNYLKVFDSENFFITFYEGIKNNPSFFLLEILDFLGASEELDGCNLNTIDNESVKLTKPVIVDEMLKEEYKKLVYDLDKKLAEIHEKNLCRISALWYNGIYSKDH